MKDFSMYKYSKGELKNPFSENDLLASKWWNGERLFYVCYNNRFATNGFSKP